VVAAGIAVPGTLGNLDAYITAVNRIPMLTAEEEGALARAFVSGAIWTRPESSCSRTSTVLRIARHYLG